MDGLGQEQQAAPVPRSIVRTTLECSICGNESAFDGIGGEWCPNCETAAHLEPREQLYRLVEIELN